MELLFEKESYKIVGAAMEVHKILGCGFLEAVYQEALAIEFRNLGVPYEKEKKIKIEYKDQTMDKHYTADFLCYDKIIIETKAVTKLSPIDKAQVINYLKATGKKLGILINFGSESLTWKRLVRL